MYFFPDFWVGRGTEGVISTKVMEVLFLERSWAGLGIVGCGKRLGSTTNGSSGVMGSNCGTGPVVTTGKLVIKVVVGSTSVGSTRSSGLHLKGVTVL